jgi:hypothetical protein
MPRLLKGDYCRSRRRCSSSSHRGFRAMCSKELVESIFFFMSIKMCNWAPGGIRKQQQEVLLVLRAPVPRASPSAHCRCRETPSIAWVKVEALWNLNRNLNLLNSLGSFSPASVSEVSESEHCIKTTPFVIFLILRALRVLTLLLCRVHTGILVSFFIMGWLQQQSENE